MRSWLFALAVVGSVFVVACSGGGGGGTVDHTYDAPSMGSASELPNATGTTPVATTADGLLLLQNAFSNSSNFVTSAPSSSVSGSKAVVTSSSLSNLLANASAAAAISKTVNPVSGSVNYTLSPTGTYPGLAVSGSANVTITSWPQNMSTLATGDVVNGSMSVTEKLVLTMANTAFTNGGTNYTVSGKEICNVNIVVAAKGTYPSLSYSGLVKIGFGIAATVIDQTHHQAAKFILSLSAEESATNTSSLPATVTGTLSIYNASDNSLIGTQSLSGTQLNSIVSIL